MKIKSLGTKLTVIACIMIAVSVLIVIFSTIMLASNHSNTIMQEKSGASLSVLKYEIDNQTDRLGVIFATMESSGAAMEAISDSTSAVEANWQKHSDTESDFMAIIKSDGTAAWKSSNYVLLDYDYKLALDGKARSGIVKDSCAGLTLQYISPVTSNGSVVGTAVIGMVLSENSYLDEVSEITGAEVTLFNGTTRYATTVFNTDGERAVGTDMSQNVAQTVINDGKVYQGTADILGQKHFVDYEPMYDMDGNIVGAYFAGFSSAESDSSFIFMTIFAIIIAAAATIVTASVLFFLIRKSVTKPIAVAEKLAQSMKAGELSVADADFNFADDEIGRFVKDLEATKHSLNSYIGDISHVLSCMADSNFGEKPSVEYVGDFEEIKTSFEKINSTLYGVIRNMNASADDVMVGANQIADGAQMLAEGTTRQATAIDELSSSIESINTKVENTARNAEEANTLSERSRTKISQQNEEMETMLSAMEDIRAKSVEISDINKTIDDIAFQTNILALNAAIEAARAGEAGKGFAVVADEVRNLAAKSAEAASHTNELISATVEAITNGVQIARNTAETMKEVMEYSENTDRLIGEITTAAEEQAEAVRQVTVGIGQISDVVQQNSATAEQTAASCEELSGQSRMLKEQVEMLKV